MKGVKMEKERKEKSFPPPKTHKPIIKNDSQYDQQSRTWNFYRGIWLKEYFVLLKEENKEMLSILQGWEIEQKLTKKKQELRIWKKKTIRNLGTESLKWRTP